MAVALYADHHVPRAVSLGLRLRGVDILTAFDDHGARLPDPALLDRATALGRVLVTFDRHLLAEAQRRQRQGTSFAGVVFAHRLRGAIGACIQDLEFLAKAGEPEDLLNRVEYLPL